MNKAAMKKMKKTIMNKSTTKRVASKIAVGRFARYAVFSGKKVRTVGGLTKELLTRSKSGKIVSKKQSLQRKKFYAKSKLRQWSAAVKTARATLGLKGFVPVGGKSANGKALLVKVRALVA